MWWIIPSYKYMFILVSTFLYHYINTHTAFFYPLSRYICYSSDIFKPIYQTLCKYPVLTDLIPVYIFDSLLCLYTLTCILSLISSSVSLLVCLPVNVRYYKHIQSFCLFCQTFLYQYLVLDSLIVTYLFTYSLMLSYNSLFDLNCLLLLCCY